MSACILLALKGFTMAGGDAGRESPFIFGSGGRGMGMGRAFVALNGDPSASFWNPGATANIDRAGFMLFHTSLFMGTNYDCFSLLYPFETHGVVSIFAGRISTGDIQERDAFNREIRSFSSAENLFGLGFGRTIAYGFSGGMSLKAASMEINSISGYGFGADIGLQYKPTILKGLIAGLSINDIIKPSIKLADFGDKYQTVSRFGLSYSRGILKNMESTVSIQYETVKDRNSIFRGGIEMAFYSHYFLRAGIDDTRMTFGAGIDYNDFIVLDYAYENIQFFGSSHRVSLAFSFGKSIARTREEARARIIQDEKESWQKEVNNQRKLEYRSCLASADSLRHAGKLEDALGYYGRAFAIDSTSRRAKSASDSVMSEIITKSISTTQDKKREELIANRIELALRSLRAGQYNDAIAQYQTVLEIEPGNTTVIDLLQSARQMLHNETNSARSKAKAYQSAGDYSSALLEWKRLNDIVPSDSEAKSGLGIARNQLKVDGLIATAVSSMRKGEYPNAVTYLQQAQSLRPSDKSILSLLSEANAKSAPLTTLDDIKASKDRWSIYLDGLENYQSGKYSKALENWESLKEFYPNNPELEKNISQAKSRLQTEGGTPKE